MRRLIAALIALTFLWCAWWWGATTLIARQTDAWLAARRAEGWRAEARISTAGFPARLQVRIADLRLTDPDTEISVAVETLVLDAPIYWPGDASLRFPETPIRIDAKGQQLMLQLTGAVAGIRLTPGPALALDEFYALSGSWSLAQGPAPLLAADDLVLRMTQVDEARNTYRIELAGENLQPAPALRLHLPDDWPETFDRLDAELQVGFDRPLDRFALQRQHPQPRRAEIVEMHIAWGPLDIRGEGAVDIAADGTPDGVLRLQLANWQPVLEVMIASGLLAEATGTQVQLFIGALANQAGDGTNLDLRLTFDDGQMALGPIALGPTPRVVPRERHDQRQ